MKLFLFQVIAFASLALLQVTEAEGSEVSHAFAGEEEDFGYDNNNEIESLAGGFLGEKRKVELQLEAMHVVVAFLSTTWVTDEPGVEIRERFKVPVDSLDRDTLKDLQDGKTVTGFVDQPIAPFRVRQGSEGLVSATAHEAFRHLLDRTAPTLCGSTKVRGLVPLSLGASEKSFVSRTSYSRLEDTGSVEGQRQLSGIQRELEPDVGDVCESIDLYFGGCDPAKVPQICVIQRQRPKRETTEVCGECGLYPTKVVFKLSYKSTTEFEYMNFNGLCKSVTGLLADDCECFPNPIPAVGGGRKLETEEDLLAANQQLYDWENEPLPADECTDKCCDAVGCGDPHFKTWDGTRFDYHGECDLVMVESHDFASGLGLHMHIRTKISGSYSYISNAAIKIGPDVFEVSGDGTHYFNGDSSLPEEFGGHALKVCEDCARKNQVDYSVNLDFGEQIKISVFKGKLHIRASVHLQDSVGLMGTTATPGMIARDGTTILKDPNAMGAEWQVNATQPKLFYINRAPQFPQACLLPDASQDATHRRLGEATFLLDMAGEACAGVDLEMQEFCMYDVQQTGDADMALPYLPGAEL